MNAATKPMADILGPAASSPMPSTLNLI